MSRGRSVRVTDNICESWTAYVSHGLQVGLYQIRLELGAFERYIVVTPCMYVYVYVCIYIYRYIDTFVTYMYVYIYIYTCIDIWI